MQKIVTSACYISLNFIYGILSVQDVDRFFILPMSPFKIDFIQKARKVNIFAKLWQRLNEIYSICHNQGFREI